MTIKRIGPLSCAKIAGVTYAALGLLIGALISLIAGMGMALSGVQQNSDAKAILPMFSAFMGVGAIIVCPILYGIVGFIGALIAAWLYNLLASWIGGIQVDIS